MAEKYKYIILLFVLFVIFGGCFAFLSAGYELPSNFSVQKAFLQNWIVPDLIPEPPNQLLEVSYRSGVMANLGNELTPTQTLEQPYIFFEADPEAYYTICLTDPDVPSRLTPTNAEFQHWLVVNVKGGDVNCGEILTEYVAAAPGLGSGLHRYTFVVYEQPGLIQFDEQFIDNRNGMARFKFSIFRFAQKYGLGDPIAGNFFQAQYDASVPQTNQQLGLPNDPITDLISYLLSPLFLI